MRSLLDGRRLHLLAGLLPLFAAPLALKQGGYDWGFLAYAVGFGGSMLWFGSSAGLAVAKLLPEVKSVSQWLRHGWLIHVGHVAGFLVMLTVLGWHAHEKHLDNLTAPASSQRLLSPGHAQ